MTIRPRDRVALVAFAAVALAVAFYLLALKPQQQKAAALGASITSQRDALALAQADISAGRQARSMVAANAEEVASLAQAVPSDAGIQALLRSLERTARSQRVRLQSIQITAASASPTPAPSATSPGGAATNAVAPVGIPIQLIVAGRYLALDAFVHRLDGYVVVTGDKVRARGRLLNISGVQIDGSPNPVAHVTATIYRLPAASAPVAPAPADAAPAGAAP